MQSIRILLYASLVGIAGLCIARSLIMMVSYKWRMALFSVGLCAFLPGYVAGGLAVLTKLVKRFGQGQWLIPLIMGITVRGAFDFHVFGQIMVWILACFAGFALGKHQARTRKK